MRATRAGLFMRANIRELKVKTSIFHIAHIADPKRLKQEKGSKSSRLNLNPSFNLPAYN
jgi:hypothetical protein